MSVSGLSASQRREARRLVKASCARLLAHPSQVHYTQGSNRWDGINHRKGIYKDGFWPFYGDCSATATWVLWRALKVPFGVHDVVNGAHWQAGYTGTQARHGKRVRSLDVGDLVLYGRAPVFEHVAVYVGNGRVMSHGSEGGPYLLPVRYRSDVGEFRRYI